MHKYLLRVKTSVERNEFLGRLLEVRDQDCPVVVTVVDFVQSPSDELLNCFHSKEQLLKLVEHYDVDIGEKRLNEEMKGR